jgi:hypothetical protein
MVTSGRAQVAIVRDRFRDETARVGSPLRRLAFALAAIAVASARGAPSGPPSGHAPAAAGNRVLVELFTSLGCSSCPPADRLLTQLGGEDPGGVVPLEFHVDYWNRGGWSDPFSRREWSERQAAYARRFGLAQVYTPQAVVGGRSQLVGSDADGIRRDVASAAGGPVAEISLRVEPNGAGAVARGEVVLPDVLRGRRLDVMLALYETGLVTPVGGGENGGRTLHNDYVVRSLDRATKISGRGVERVPFESRIAPKKDANSAALGVAVFVQDPKTLEIFGAVSQPIAAAR